MKRTPKKPDGFAAMVEKITVNPGLFGGSVMPLDAVDLLRRYHAKVRRLVRKLQREIEEGPDPEHPINRAHHLAYDNLLAALDRLKKGPR